MKDRAEEGRLQLAAMPSTEDDEEGSKAEKLTRQLKADSVQLLIDLALAWLGQKKHDQQPHALEAGADQRKGGSAPDSAVSSKVSDLAGALQKASKVHGIGYPNHLRDSAHMHLFLEEILGYEKEEQLEKSRIIWRRMEKAANTFAASLKSSTLSLKKHLDKYEADKAKAAQKAKELEERDGARKQKEELSSKVSWVFQPHLV